ncbi:hypothetical protein [[Mycobacterium] zoologicum]|uniref:hypothetical protein n=1 Tax=[Mycobacterium] zoologicum TaxID=2872311 RepID=UPI002C0DB486|nr:hypothetical protein [Mycolicibacter sp. MYC101]MEB3065716.1 hypothetical protein [Mycolicibacter sp. MYC101]
MQLDWMLVSKSYDEADGALMPGRAVKHGIIARIGDGEVYLEIWPSEPPEHIEDRVTLTLTMDGVVVEEIERLASYDAARAAAHKYFEDHGGQVPGAR